MREKMKGISFPRGKKPDKKPSNEVSKGEMSFGSAVSLIGVLKRIDALEKRVEKLERRKRDGSR